MKRPSSLYGQEQTQMRRNNGGEKTENYIDREKKRPSIICIITYFMKTSNITISTVLFVNFAECVCVCGIFAFSAAHTFLMF